MNSIGERVKYLIESKGLTAYEVSHESGISEATLSRIVNKNTKPNIKNCKILADYFQVEKEWLLTGVKPVQKPVNYEVKENDFDLVLEPREDPYTLSLIELLFSSQLFKNKIIDLVNNQPKSRVSKEEGLKMIEEIEKMIKSKASVHK